MKNLLVKLLFIILLAGLILAGVLYNQYDKFLQSPVFKQLPVEFEIRKGSSFSDFFKLVQKNQGSGNDWQWRLLARIYKYNQHIKAGEYTISQAMSPRELVEYIDENNVKNYQVTLVEGNNWQQIKQSLFASPDLINKTQDLSDDELIKVLNIKANHLEGQFLPETYQFIKHDTDLDVLNRAHMALKKELDTAWQNRADNLVLKNKYELLIIASIIEKETAKNAEREIVSGVFHRRLQKNMKLQTDPTVIYGIGESYAGDITSKHLITDTPYNTYTRKGLPPTPIAMASAASIQAAAHPNDGDELYFVADNKGGHNFSKTYAEHLKAVKAYLKGSQN